MHHHQSLVPHLFSPFQDTVQVLDRLLLLNSVVMYFCSIPYVCMYRGHPSWRCPWDRAFQLAQGEGPIGFLGPISQPRGTIDTASLRTNALGVF